jgi:hypothetical protein
MVLLVLLIACANVANLLLAVAVARRQEAAIKLALGAPRGWLIREFLAESMLLCVASGLLGFGVAAWVIRRFSDFRATFPMFGEFSFGLHLPLNATVVAFTLVLTMVAILATGLAPALYASSPGLAQVLGGEMTVGGTRKAARRNVPVIVEVAIATLVLVGMGLCQRNLHNLRHADLGFSARNLVAATVYLDAEGYSGERGKQFHETLRRTAAALPGVESVSLAWELPLFGDSEVPVQLQDGGKPVSVSHTVVDNDYFRTFGIRILSGRAFDSRDHENGQAVIVINRKIADQFFLAFPPLSIATVLRSASCKQSFISGQNRLAASLLI